LVLAAVAHQDAGAGPDDERALRGAEDERRPVVGAGRTAWAERVDLDVDVLLGVAGREEVAVRRDLGEPLARPQRVGQQQGVRNGGGVYLGRGVDRGGGGRLGGLGVRPRGGGGGRRGGGV